MHILSDPSLKLDAEIEAEADGLNEILDCSNSPFSDIYSPSDKKPLSSEDREIIVKTGKILIERRKILTERRKIDDPTDIIISRLLYEHRHYPPPDILYGNLNLENPKLEDKEIREYERVFKAFMLIFPHPSGVEKIRHLLSLLTDGDKERSRATQVDALIFALGFVAIIGAFLAGRWSIGVSKI